MRHSDCIIAVVLSASTVAAQRLTVVNSWLGNSGGTPASHIMHNVDNMFVRSDGTVYAVTGWDEGGHNVSVFRDGAQVAVPEESGTGGWGRMSGRAVTADDTYIYQVLTQHGCDGGNANLNQNGLPQYPPCLDGKGPVWNCIARYNQNGTLAPFPEGYGFKGAYLLVNVNGRIPSGIAVYDGELFVADPTGDTVKVYATSNLTTRPVRSYAVARVGLLSPDGRGSLWMLQPADSQNSATLVRFSTATATVQPQRITFPPGVIPTAFCVDAGRDRILVTDNGVNQNIRIYEHVSTAPAFASTFGVQGGILSGVAGEVGPLRFVNPMGVGVDSAGNIYVASTGLVGGSSRGTAVESYTPEGSRRWVLYGLVFTGVADADRESPTDVFTFDRRFVMDYSRRQPGSEWSYAGYTLNSFKYPEDARLQDIFFTSALVRTVQSRRILYISDMYGSCLAVYRFNRETDGVTAIPCGFFSTGRVGAGWPNGHPLDKEWLWCDRNNDGRYQTGEFDANPVDNDYAMAWWVDSAGGVWKGVREQGLRYFPLQGFDPTGAPLYSYASSVKYPLPTGTNGVKRICYDAARDALYLAGFSAERPDTGDTWWCMGSTLCKYGGWMQGNRRPTWTILLPFAATGDNGTNAKAFCVEGDYVFVAAAREGRISVYRESDGTLVGTIEPGAETDRRSGWTDINIAVTACKRSNGEYLVFMEENGFGKVMMYRWCPSGSCAENGIAVPVGPTRAPPWLPTSGRRLYRPDGRAARESCAKVPGVYLQRTTVGKGTRVHLIVR